MQNEKPSIKERFMKTIQKVKLFPKIWISTLAIFSVAVASSLVWQSINRTSKHLRNNRLALLKVAIVPDLSSEKIKAV